MKKQALLDDGRNQMRKRSECGVVIALVCALLAPAQAADKGRIVKSAVFPGMGQLGDGQVVKGLLIMGGEAALLSAMFGQMSRMSSYAFETKRLDVVYRIGGEYDSVATTYGDWKDAYDRSQKAQTGTIVFGVVAAAWWVLNVVDAWLLAPKKISNEDENSFLNTMRKNTRVAVTRTGAQVTYALEF
jgi:hypothetical protein